MYKSLYRVYRPKVFNEVLGQELIVLALKNAIIENKIAHAFLFAGSSGVGKTTLAKIFAKAMNCLKENKPCLECEICKLIDQNKITDVIEMDAASNNGVDEIRNLIENVKYPPTKCKYKVYIIDEVHMLSKSAFNALLKTLEEPPSNTIFILATTEEHKVPETILTRCQKFYFSKVNDESIISLLSDIARNEKKEFTIEAIELIAEMANGGVRQAISIFEKCIGFSETLNSETINKVYGLLKKSEIKVLCNAIYTNDKKIVFNVFEKIKNFSSNYSIILEEILSFLKEYLIFEIDQDYKFKYFNKNDNLSFSKTFISIFLKSVIKTTQEIRFSNNSKLFFEIMILQMLNWNENQKDNIKIENVENKEEIKSISDSENSNSLFSTQKQEEEKKINDLSLNKANNDENSKINKEKDNNILKNKENNEIAEKTSMQNIISELKDEEKSMLKEIDKQKVLIDEEKEQNKDNVDLKEVSSEHIKLENEIINVLLRSEKKYREFFKIKWDDLKRYLEIPGNTRWVKMIFDSKLIAATNNVIVLLFEHEPSANILNGENKNQDFVNLMYEIFGQDVLFLGVWIDVWEKIKSDFIYKKNNNQLPKYMDVFIPKAIIEKKDSQNKELNEIQNIFGENIVEEVE